MIMLRADIDALPMTENNPGLSYEAKNGAAHMCGHDGHTACLLGGLYLILKNLEKIPSNRRVRILFQPAEEKSIGAKMMIKAGVLEEVDEVYGIHCRPWPSHPSEVIVKSGSMYAGSIKIFVEIKGKGGHGAYPEKCLNPLPATAEAYLAVNKSLKELNDANPDSMRYSICSFKASDAYNSIPSESSFEGTARVFKQNLIEDIQRIVKREVSKVVENTGLESHIKVEFITKPVNNTPECALFIEKTAKKIFGDDKVSGEGPPTFGGEDFSFFMAERPGCFFWRTIRAAPEDAYLHTPKMNFDDRVIESTSELWCRIAVDRLNQL